MSDPCRRRGWKNSRCHLASFFFFFLGLFSEAPRGVSAGSAAAPPNSWPKDGLHRRLLRVAQRRRLAVGDFDAVNDAWGSLVVPFPDQAIVEEVAGTEVVVNLTRLTCTGWNVGDVQLAVSDGGGSGSSTSTTSVRIDVVDVDVQCQTLYSYDSVLSSGNGSAFLVTRDNQVSLDLSLFLSGIDGLNASMAVELDGCDSAVNIEEFELEPGGSGGAGGGLGTGVLERLLRGVMERQIETALCERAADAEAVLQEGLDRLGDALSGGPPGAGDAATGSPSDALIAESMLNPTVDWLHFKDPESIVEKVVSKILFEQQDLWVGLLWETLLVQKGLDLNLEVEDFSFATVLGNVTLRVQSARIQAPEGGSPTVTDLSAVSFATLSMEATLPTLSVQLGLELEIEAGNQTYVDTALISIPLSSVAVALTALVAVDEGRLGSLTVGSVLFEKWDCFASALQRASVYQFELSFETEAPTISGLSSSPGLKRLLQDVTALGFELYGDLLQTNMVHWIQETVLSLDWALQDRPASSNCSDFGGDRSAFIDFRDLLLSPEESAELGGSGTMPYGSLLPSLKGYLSELLSDDSSVSSLVDSAIGTGSEYLVGTSKLMMWTKPLVDKSSFVTFGEEHMVAVLRVDQLTLENAVSFSQPAILDPVRGDAFSLNNSVVLTPSQPLRVSARVLVKFDLQYDGIDAIENEFILGVEVQSLELAMRAIAKVYAERVMKFPLSDLLNWRCWMATVLAPSLDSQGFRVEGSEPTLSASEVDVVLTNMSFYLDCINCTGQKFDDLSMLLDAAPTDELARQSALDVVDYLISLVEGDSSALQIAIDRMLVEAPKYCPHCDEYNPYAKPTEYASLASSDSKPTSLVVMVVLLVLAVTLSVTFEIWSAICRRRKRRRWLASLSESELRQVQECHDNRVKEERVWNDASESLLQRKETSRWVRWLVPVVIIGNCALFLSGHVSTGGEVRVFLYFGGEEVVLRDLYAFSIAQICLDLWRVGSRGVAVILILFAIVWPYVKQLLTLFLWVVPPRIVNVRRRGAVLQWLDVLAKWSMIDVFVIILSVPAFHIEISSPEKGFLPPNFYRLELAVIPLWGFYANLLAQIMSQGTSHVLLHYHRLAANQQKSPHMEAGVTGTSESDSDDREAPPIAETLWPPRYTPRPPAGMASRRSAAITSLLALATVVLLLLGCLLPSYSFDYRGLLGVAIESGMNFGEALESFSVISTAQDLMDQARSLGSSADVFGMLLFAAVLVMTVLIVPTALAGSLATERLASGGMRPARRKRLRVAIEILQAWQYTEVYLLSVVLAVWQFSDVSTILCGGLSGLFSLLVSSGVLDPSDAQCFQAQASLQAASFLLFAASTCLFLMSKVSRRARDGKGED